MKTKECKSLEITILQLVSKRESLIEAIKTKLRKISNRQDFKTLGFHVSWTEVDTNESSLVRPFLEEKEEAPNFNLGKYIFKNLEYSFEKLNKLFSGCDPRFEYSVKLLTKYTLRKIAKILAKLAQYAFLICSLIANWREDFGDDQTSCLKENVYFQNKNYLVKLCTDLNFLQGTIFENRFSLSENFKSSLSLSELYQIEFKANPFLSPLVLHDKIHCRKIWKWTAYLKQEREIDCNKNESNPHQVFFQHKSFSSCGHRDFRSNTGGCTKPTIIEVLNSIRDDFFLLRKFIQKKKTQQLVPISESKNLDRKRMVLKRRNRKKNKRKQPSRKQQLEEEKLEQKLGFAHITEKYKANPKSFFYERLVFLPGYLMEPEVVTGDNGRYKIRFKLSKDIRSFLKNKVNILIISKVKFDASIKTLGCSYSKINSKLSDRKVLSRLKSKEIVSLRGTVMNEETMLSLEIEVEVKALRHLCNNFNHCFQNIDPETFPRPKEELVSEIIPELFYAKVAVLVKQDVGFSLQKDKIIGELNQGSFVILKEKNQHLPELDMRYKLFTGDIIRLGGFFISVVSLVEVLEEQQGFVISCEPVVGSDGAFWPELINAGVEVVAITGPQDIFLKDLEKPLESKSELDYRELLSSSYEFFGLKMRAKKANAHLGEDLYNKSQLNFVKNLDKEKILFQTFEYLCFNWYPPASKPNYDMERIDPKEAEILDAFKFMKFIKSLPDLIKLQKTDDTDITLTEVDIIFAKVKPKKKKRINYLCFRNQALDLIARKKFPWFFVSENEEPAEVSGKGMEELVVNYLLKWVETKEIVLVETRKLALYSEARQQLGALKIQVSFRCFICYKTYKETLKKIVVIQKAYISYRNKCEFKEVLRRNRMEKEKKKKERQLRRENLKTSLVYSGCHMILNRFVVLSMQKQATGDLQLVSYIVKTKQQLSLFISKSKLLSVVKEALRKKVVSEGKAMNNIDQIIEDQVDELVQQVFNPDLLYRFDYLKHLIRRLKLRVKLGELVLVIARKEQNGAQGNIIFKGVVSLPNVSLRTKKLLTTGSTSRSPNDFLRFQLTLYSSLGSFMFEFYDPKRKTIELMRLTKIQLEEHFPDSSFTLLEIQSLILSRMSFCESCSLGSHKVSHKLGKYVLMFQFEQAESHLILVATKLQSIFRGNKARVLVKSVIRKAYRKQRDMNTQQWYYYNTRTGESSWEKPFIFKYTTGGLEETVQNRRGALTGLSVAPNIEDTDLGEPDKDLWVQFYEDGAETPKYFHPFTGRVSKYSKIEAQQFLRRLYLNRQNRLFQISDMKQLVTTLNFHNNLVKRYKENRKRLSSVVNYALYVLTIENDLQKSKMLFMESLQNSPKNVLIRVMKNLIDIFECKKPYVHFFEVAEKNISDLKSESPRLEEEFEVAYKIFFHWAAITIQTSTYPFIYCAICQLLIFNNLRFSRAYFSKGFSVQKSVEQAKTDPRLPILYNYFQYKL
eukprot:snap_masked-scaffold_4-processed-gene-16.30-mRNA-1 protein AED:1.00 eAED:1.00 QI:0/-1/0/0/-1/1/1/0/1470